ncbi:MAG: hypothetical protein QOJ46_1677 [bacterium]
MHVRQSAWRAATLLTTTAGAVAQVLVAQRRLRALERYGREPAGSDALDDVRDAALAVVRLVAAAPIVGPAAQLAERTVGRALAADAPVARAQRRHPWRFGATAALLAGLLASAVHVVAEGPPTDGVAVAGLVTLVITAIEAAAVFGCYVVFGRFLGIRIRGSSHAAS